MDRKASSLDQGPSCNKIALAALENQTLLRDYTINHQPNDPILTFPYFNYYTSPQILPNLKSYIFPHHRPRTRNEQNA